MCHEAYDKIRNVTVRNRPKADTVLASFRRAESDKSRKQREDQVKSYQLCL